MRKTPSSSEPMYVARRMDKPAGWWEATCKPEPEPGFVTRAHSPHGGIHAINTLKFHHTVTMREWWARNPVIQRPSSDCDITSTNDDPADK